MKKLILSASALFLSLGCASAQNWVSTGVHDDFATATEYSNGANGEGIYWFQTTGGDTLSLSRTAGKMSITVDKAGACNGTTNPATPGMCYPLMGVQFGDDGGTPAVPNTLNLSAYADVQVTIRNTHATQQTYMDVILEDVNGVQAAIEPNISDVTSTSWAAVPAPTDRKALNGFVLPANTTKTVKIDLSSVPGKVGGLTIGSYLCNGPADCPTTSYAIDITKIKAILFRVNFGKDNIDLSEGDGNHQAESFIMGSGITAFTGVLEMTDFRVGSFVTGINESKIDNSLQVYPNPAKDALNVSFESTAGAKVTLSDIVGNEVYTTSANAGENKITMNTTSLTQGLYILNVATENGKVARKVMIK